ncbi:MAG: hypothetical protein PSX81_06340 [bacterium]|nr:hypothetical protein [bacterium]
MDFLSKNNNFLILALLLLCSSCTDQDFELETNKITANVTAPMPSNANLTDNILYSDLFNWNDFEFKFKEYIYDEYTDYKVAVFEAQGPSGASKFELDFDGNFFKSETGYYFLTQVRIDANKLSGNNFKGYANNVTAHYLPIDDKYATVFFETTVLTDIRNPSSGSTYLSKNIKGKFIVPIK